MLVPKWSLGQNDNCPGRNRNGHEAAGEGEPRTALEVPVTTRGVLYVHSAPRALCPHVEWAVAGVLGVRVNLDWIRQPASPGTWRAEFSWQGEAGTASSWPPRCAAGICCASR